MVQLLIFIKSGLRSGSPRRLRAGSSGSFRAGSPMRLRAGSSGDEGSGRMMNQRKTSSVSRRPGKGNIYFPQNFIF